MERKKQKIESLRLQIDTIEQNLKRRNVRIVGLPEANEPEEDLNLEQTIMNIANDHLDLNLERTDIEKIHRMGRVNSKKPRDIIMTFSNQELRNKFYNSRKKTPKYHENQIYINEDLTTFRAKLYYDIRQLVKRKKIHSAWTQQGNSYAEG